MRPLGLGSEQQPTSHLTLGTLVGEDQSLLCFIFLLLFQLQSKHSFPAEKKNSSVQSWKQIISHAGRKKACRGGRSYWLVGPLIYPEWGSKDLIHLQVILLVQKPLHTTGAGWGF